MTTRNTAVPADADPRRRARRQPLRAIPEGFLTVGELAKQMRTTVRTLQFYDRIGLLIPAGESAGGRRLYDDADVVRLNQILALKQLGFSLEEIRDRLVNLDSPAAVAEALNQQAGSVRAQIANLTKALNDIELLRAATLRWDRVDFTKYAEILILLRESHDTMWVLEVAGDQFRDRIIDLDTPARREIWDEVISTARAAAALHAQGVPPDSPEGQAVADRMWRAAQRFTGGDPAVLADLEAFEERSDKWDGKFAEAYSPAARTFLHEAMNAGSRHHTTADPLTVKEAP